MLLGVAVHRYVQANYRKLHGLQVFCVRIDKPLVQTAQPISGSQSIILGDKGLIKKQ